MKIQHAILLLPAQKVLLPLATQKLPTTIYRLRGGAAFPITLFVARKKSPDEDNADRSW